MSPDVKKWLYRGAAAVLGVVATAVGGIVPDAGHFGQWALIVGLLQGVLLTVIGEVVRKWGAAE